MRSTPGRKAEPNNGASQFIFSLSELDEVSLSDWPAFEMVPRGLDGRALIEEAKRNWQKAEEEARRHWDAVRVITAASPYPARSYCLGGAEVVENRVRIRYFLFPTLTPTEQVDAVAQLIYEARIGAPAGEIDEIWVDDLRDDELSVENRRRIREAITN